MSLKSPLLTSALMAVSLSFALPAASLAQDTPLSAMPSGKYELDLSHASLLWKVKHLGLSMYTARFIDFDAEVMLDADTFEDSALSVTIEADSVTTDYPYLERVDWDEELATGEKFLNAGKYPQITFTSTQIEAMDETTGKITGDLTFLGQTHPVTLDVTFFGAMEAHPRSKKPMMGFSATGSFERSKFGMGHLIPIVGDTVELVIQTEFSKAE